MGKLRLISDSLQFADCICLQHNLRFCSKTKCTADRHRLSTEAYLRLIGPIREKRLSLLTCSSSWTKPLTQMFRLYHLSSTKLFKAHEVNEPCKKWKNMWKRTKRKAGSGPFRVPFVKLLWIWNHEIGRIRRSRVASLAARHRVRHPTGHGRHCRCHEPHCYPWPTAAPGSVFIMFYYSSPIHIWYPWYL